MRYAIPEYVSWFSFGDEVVLVDTRRGRRSQLNEAGAQLWQELGNGADESTLVERLAPLADGSLAETRDYVREWAQALVRARLLYIMEDGR